MPQCTPRSSTRYVLLHILVVQLRGNNKHRPLHVEVETVNAPEHLVAVRISGSEVVQLCADSRVLQHVHRRRRCVKHRRLGHVRDTHIGAEGSRQSVAVGGNNRQVVPHLSLVVQRRGRRDGERPGLAGTRGARQRERAVLIAGRDSKRQKVCLAIAHVWIAARNAGGHSSASCGKFGDRQRCVKA